MPKGRSSFDRESQMNRLDHYLVELGLAENRSKAQALIMSGQVLLNGQKIIKSGQNVKKDDLVEVKEQLAYVSRGGLKLEGALADFSVDPRGKSIIDVGASTGGFTDCLLQRGAVYCYCFDAGYNQLAYKLREDPRVDVHEKVNFRYFNREHFQKIENKDKPYPSLAVVDVSFISLQHILIPLYQILNEGAEVIALVKPQFEADREDVGKGGIVRDPLVWEKVQQKVNDFAQNSGYQVKGQISSPISGKTGNKEFFIYLIK